MKLIRNAIAAGMLAGSTAIVACSGQLAPTSSAGGNREVDNPGGTTNPGGTPSASTAASAPGLPSQGSVAIGMTTSANTGSVITVLTLPASGPQLQSFSYTISGASGVSYASHTRTIGDAQSTEWVSGGIVAGCGYTIAVTGEDSAGDACSATSESFCVLAGEVTTVSLSVACASPAGEATLILDASAIDSPPAVVDQGTYVCPGIGSFSVSPAEIVGSQTATLSITRAGASTGTFVWSETSTCSTGTVDGFFGPDGGPTSSGDSLSFGCGSCVGTVTVTAQAQLEVVPAGLDASTNVCTGVPFTSYSGNILCEGGGAIAASTD